MSGTVNEDRITFECPPLPCRRCGDRTYHRLFGDPRCLHCIAAGPDDQREPYQRPIRLQARALAKFRARLAREKEQAK